VISRNKRLRFIVFLCVGTLTTVHADKLDDFTETLIQKRKLVGLSLTVIDGSKIVKTKGYGFADKDARTPVTPFTLFQAGSVSKSVAAMGALRLVEAGKLSLDADVNTKLNSWKVPENEFTKTKKVTLRRILSHSAGLTVHGFPGYAADKPIPTLVQVLDGAKPANTPAIRVDFEPGTKLRYSGGGYTVMQQMIIDVTGQPFPYFMQETVLTPLSMTNSRYAQPLPVEWAAKAATGYYSGGKAVEGKWHIYPEMAAAGLWTTATDLAKFAIGIQQSFANKSNSVISQSMARQMLTDQGESDGLGVFLKGSGDNLRFMHNGRDEGFDAVMIAYARTGQGAVILINSNDDSMTLARLLDAIAREYHWPAGH
jgi:CubicO group peptidase (beta-lactamase class C family)